MKTKKDIIEIIREGYIDPCQLKIHHENIDVINNGYIDIIWIEFLNIIHRLLKRVEPTNKEYKAYAIDRSKTIAILKSYNANKNQC